MSKVAYYVWDTVRCMRKTVVSSSNFGVDSCT